MSSATYGIGLIAVISALGCNDAVDLNAAQSEAFIIGNASLDSACNPQLERSLGNGVFDIASGGDWAEARKSQGCATPYVLNLVVEGPSGEVAVFDEASVTLIDSEYGGPISFDDQSRLPNPYKVLTSGSAGGKTEQGVIPAAVIPAKYKDGLGDYTGEGIEVAVKLKGTTRSGKTVSTQGFRFPLRICRGCLAFCSFVFDPEVTEEDIYGAGTCRDNAGADGRICIDPGCEY